MNNRSLNSRSGLPKTRDLNFNRLRVLVPTSSADSRTPRGNANPPVANSARTLRELIASTTRLTQARRRRMHRQLRGEQAEPKPTEKQTPQTRTARRTLHMDDPLPTSDSRSPTTSYPLTHGHAPVPWSAELDKIKAPTLSEKSLRTLLISE